MQTVTAEFVKDKKVLLRYDCDVPLTKLTANSQQWTVEETFRLKAGIETLKLCLEAAQEVVLMGHLGRPEGQEVPELSIAPVAKWLKDYCQSRGIKGNLTVLENLRFDGGEDGVHAETAMELAHLGQVYVNEAFAAHHQAASTTLLPTLMPSRAGLRFAKEVETLLQTRQHPSKPLVALIGGAKIEDKYPAILELAKFCDFVLVGGLLPKQIQEAGKTVPANVRLAKVAESGIDISTESTAEFSQILTTAKEVIWAGPMGKYEDSLGNKGNLELAKAIIQSGARSIIGGGDTIAALDFYLDKFSFVSTGGGAMLELLTKGSLPTIAALK